MLLTNKHPHFYSSSNCFVTVAAFQSGATCANNLREQQSTTVTITELVPFGPTMAYGINLPITQTFSFLNLFWSIVTVFAAFHSIYFRRSFDRFPFSS